MSLLSGMVARKSACLRRAARGKRAEIVRYGRFLDNPKVTVDSLIEGWGRQTAIAAGGRHVLAIHDTSEINFHTSPDHRRGLGEIARGNSHGVLLHAMLAVDAQSSDSLGLVAGEIWTRQGRQVTPHEERPAAERESQRWLSTACAGKQVLSAAAMVTVIGDRESDIYSAWAQLPEDRFHVLSRSMQDAPGRRRLAGRDGGGFAVADRRTECRRAVAGHSATPSWRCALARSRSKDPADAMPACRRA
jgi:hypothetical protein